MKQFIQRTGEGFAVYKVAFLKVCVGTYLAGLAVWTGSGTAWSSMGHDEQTNLILCISGAMGTYLMGFFDRTLSRIDDEQKQKNGTQTVIKP